MQVSCFEKLILLKESDDRNLLSTAEVDIIEFVAQNISNQSIFLPFYKLIFMFSGLNNRCTDLSN